MWWKIYLWLTIFLALVTIASFFVDYPPTGWFTAFNNIVFYIEIYGLFVYLYKKTIFPQLVWKYFFWLNIIIDALYLLYAFYPHTFLTNYLTVFFGSAPHVDIILFADLAIDVPLLYAIYHVAKGVYYEPQKKTKKIPKKTIRFRWGMLQMALWGYSFVLTFILFISSFFLSNSSTSSNSLDLTYITYVTTMFAPVFLFWVWVLIEYKQYTWNWWRTTLLANALLYSGLLIFGIFSPPSGKGSSSDFDFIGIFQLLILLLGFYVFGKDQFDIAKDELS